MSEIIKKAKDKLTEELKNFKGGRKEKAVSSYVAKTLKEFCKEEAFANTVAASGKTLSDCCGEIMKKCGNHISDFTVYKKAAKFYFPGAKVDFTMTIKLDKHLATLSNFEPTVDEKSVKKRSSKTGKKKNMDNTIQISLFDFMEE